MRTVPGSGIPWIPGTPYSYLNSSWLCFGPPCACGPLFGRDAYSIEALGMGAYLWAGRSDEVFAGYRVLGEREAHRSRILGHTGPQCSVFERRFESSVGDAR